MKVIKSVSRFISFPVAAGVLLVTAGCAGDPQISEEFARIASQEIANMDANSSGMIPPAGTPKLAAVTDSITYDLVIHPYSWDAASASYVRLAVLTCSDGYERTRIDTITFYGNAGPIQNPTFAAVDSIRHVRRVTRTRGGSELNIIVDMHAMLASTASGYTHVKNGSMTGTFDGEQVATGTIVNVTRTYSTATGWQLWPESGSITADFPRRLFEIDFLGEGFVKLSITNKATDRTRTLTVAVDQQ
ncbi:MAG: hypothetical protein JW699_05080 [Chitinispirillaceae bacterium]|nr:hypothetical protein [Chitinispirillaceae bacterium]